MTGPASFTGGARIGWTNASWPLATLNVDATGIDLSVRVLGNHRFVPSDVVSVKRITWFPVLGWGVQIHHTRRDLPTRIIFWTLGSPQAILDAIQQSGFAPQGRLEDVPLSRGFPFRWQALVGLAALWNALIYLDLRAQPDAYHAQAGAFSLLALFIVFAASVLVRRPGAVQQTFLKSPDALPRVRAGINLVSLVTGLLTVAHLVHFAVRWGVEAAR